MTIWHIITCLPWGNKCIVLQKWILTHCAKWYWKIYTWCCCHFYGFFRSMCAKAVAIKLYQFCMKNKSLTALCNALQLETRVKLSMKILAQFSSAGRVQAKKAKKLSRLVKTYIWWIMSSSQRCYCYMSWGCSGIAFGICKALTV